jgi:hypothetical protein
MSSATTADRVPTAPADASPGPGARRRAETWVATAGLVLSTVLLGGFTVVMNQVDETAFYATLHPEMQGIGLDLTTAAVPGGAFEAARTLAAWFGLTLMVVLALGTTGIFAAGRRRGRRAAVWIFAATGLACLVGSQMILYPVAFLFFLSAGMSALRTSPRRPSHGSTR